MNINSKTTIGEGGKLAEHQPPDRAQGEQNEDNNLEPHPLGRFIRYGGRDHFRRHSADPSTWTFFRQSPPLNGPSSTT